jgi:hypothetical protein
LEIKGSRNRNGMDMETRHENGPDTQGPIRNEQDEGGKHSTTEQITGPAMYITLE